MPSVFWDGDRLLMIDVLQNPNPQTITGGFHASELQQVEEAIQEMEEAEAMKCEFGRDDEA